MLPVSIVIPCRNSETYLDEALGSVFAQSFQDFEVICVDNESTDRTREILDKWASKHSNLKVLSHVGLAPRNAGVDAATGEWLYVFDSDDIMMPDLLEKAYKRALESDADIVVFRVCELNNLTGEIVPADYAFETSWLPDGVISFNPEDYPGHILTSFQNWAWNKLFKTSFVRERNIRFQEVHRTADLLFTCQALTEAQTIALLPEYLHCYRVNNLASALQTSDRYPTDFILAFDALKTVLVENGTWEVYRDSFVNWAMDGITINLYLTRTIESFTSIVDMLKDGYLDRLGIIDYPMDKAYDQRKWEDCHIVANGSLPEIIFHYLQLEKRSALEARISASNARIELSDLQARFDLLQKRFDFTAFGRLMHNDAIRRYGHFVRDKLDSVRH